MAQVKVADELGKAWIVYDNDTGYPLCRTLMKAGIEQLVLPRSALLMGVLPPSDYPEIEATTELIQAFPEVREAVQRGIRLRDCVEFLRRQEVTV